MQNSKIMDEIEETGAESPLKTVNHLVNKLVYLGSSDKVHAFHDDYLSLERDLSAEFLSAPINTDEEKFEEELERVLYEANIILSLYDMHIVVINLKFVGQK